MTFKKNILLSVLASSVLITSAFASQEQNTQIQILATHNVENFSSVTASFDITPAEVRDALANGLTVRGTAEFCVTSTHTDNDWYLKATAATGFYNTTDGFVLRKLDGKDGAIVDTVAGVPMTLEAIDGSGESLGSLVQDTSKLFKTEGTWNGSTCSNPVEININVSKANAKDLSVGYYQFKATYTTSDS